MSEKKYIDADLLKSELKALQEQERLEYMGAYDCINSIPAADVAEVRHGEWTDVAISENFYQTVCSECGKHIPKGIYGVDFHSDYCPHCGAKMDKERQ